MQYAGIQVWGDSVLKGVVYDPARHRYTLLKDSAISMLSRTFKVPFENLSRMGRTAPEALAAMKSMDGAAVRDKLVVIEYGATTATLTGRGADAPTRPTRPYAGDQSPRRSGRCRPCAQMGGTPLFGSLPPRDPRRYLKWIVKDGWTKAASCGFWGCRSASTAAGILLRAGDAGASEINCRWLPLRRLSGRGPGRGCAVRGRHPPPTTRGTVIYDAAVAFEKNFRWTRIVLAKAHPRAYMAAGVFMLTIGICGASGSGKTTLAGAGSVVRGNRR
jgi:hypothetical protein